MSHTRLHAIEILMDVLSDEFCKATGGRNEEALWIDALGHQFTTLQSSARDSGDSTAKATTAIVTMRLQWAWVKNATRGDPFDPVFRRLHPF
jgi:hypothetical protein